jgi:hypothetical protein
MARTTLFQALLCAGALGTAASANAHHAFASTFDAEQPLTLTGTVARVDWRNPHTWFYVDVTDAQGNVTRWGMELASPNLLMRNGWTRSTMRPGDVVTVEGYRAKNGTPIANARVVVLKATGQRLFASAGAGKDVS